MSETSEIRGLLKQRFQEKQNRIGAIPGQLGDGFGHIAVSGREHYVYCRLAGSTVEVFNNRVPAENDLLVMVGYDPTQPDLFQVLSTRSSVPGGTSGGTITGYASSSRYQWMATDGGQDPLFIDKRAYLPLRIGAMTGMLLQVYRDFIWTGTGWVAVNTQNFSLSSYIPATAGKCALVLITIDNTGTIVKTKGAEVDIAALALTDLPAVPAGTVEVLGAVRVYNGQTAIYEARTNTDIIDLRDTWKEASSETTTIADHDHSGDAGDGGAFFLTNLLSTGATSGQVPTADGAGGITWTNASGGLESWFSVKTYGATGDGTTNDTTAIQAALDAAATGGGVVYFPAGTYIVSRLDGHKNVAMIGAGRESTTIKGNTAGVNLVTILGSAKDSYYEVDHAPTIEGITFDGNNITPVGFGFVGVAYFDIHRCTFKRFTTTGVDFYASLQMRVDDTKFLSNATGIKYHAENIAYYGGTLPPNRVIVTWSTFYDNTYRAIDYSGGQQLIIENSEFGNNGTEGNASTAAIWFTGTGDPDGPGLVLRGGWLEHNHGYAAINIAASASILRHSIEDTFFAYTDATYGIAVDGSSGQTFVAFEQVSMDTSGTVRTYYHTGANLELDFENCTGVLSGTGGVIRQDPMLDGSPTPGITFSDAEGDPVTVDATAAADGTSDYAARRDHRHQLGAHTHTASEIVDLPATSGKYRAMLYEVSGGTFTFLTDATGNPLEGLVALE